MLVEIVISAGILYVAWKLSKPKPKKPAPKELCVDEVLKQADQALSFDPLADVKNRPAAVKPLLSVLLAIREKRAEEELAEEEHQRKHGNTSLGWRALSSSRRRIEPPQSAEEKKIVADLLSGVVGPDHPHYRFTEAGRRAASAAQAAEAAQQDMRNEALDAYVNAPPYQGVGNYQAIGYNALAALNPVRHKKR